MLLILLFPISGSADSESVVINEVQITGGAGQTTNDFVKLYNPTSLPFNLKGHRLVKRTSTGTKDISIKSWISDAFVPAHGFYTWANSGYVTIITKPDVTTSQIISNDNGVALRQGVENTGTVIDSVAWGAAQNSFIETSPYPDNPGPNQSIKRNPDGYDTDNNANDFVITGQADDAENIEDNSEASNLDGVYINELMPDPESPKLDISDEWIELYNNSDFRVDLSGARLKDSSNSEGYKIADGIFIEPKRYAIFYSSATRIQLNNSGDSVKLLDRNGTIVDETPDYGKAEAGLSFALFEDGWKWTKAPTPLSENVFEAVLKEAESKKATVSQAKKKSGKKESGKSKKSLGKSKKKSGKVKGAKADYGSDGDEDFLGESSQPINNKTLGMVLVSGAAILGFSYLIFREKVYEYFKQKS